MASLLSHGIFPIVVCAYVTRISVAVDSAHVPRIDVGVALGIKIGVGVDVGVGIGVGTNGGICYFYDW